MKKLNDKKTTINCSKCESLMKKTTHSTGNFTGIVLALIVFTLGVAALSYRLFGIVIGILLILISLGMGGKRYKIWKCNNCGYYFKYL